MHTGVIGVGASSGMRISSATVNATMTFASKMRAAQNERKRANIKLTRYV